MPSDGIKTRGLGESSGLLLLSLAVFLAVANSVLFAVAMRLPVIPISRGGLVFNSLAVLVAWFAFVKGKREGFLQQLTAVVLLSAVHYHIACNIWAVAAFGL